MIPDPVPFWDNITRLDVAGVIAAGALAAFFLVPNIAVIAALGVVAVAVYKRFV